MLKERSPERLGQGPSAPEMRIVKCVLGPKLRCCAEAHCSKQAHAYGFWRWETKTALKC